MATTQSIYPLDSSLTFAAAAPKWLKQHRRYIKPNTLRNYQAAAKLLAGFFGSIRLQEITVDHFRRYQEVRGENACAHSVNGELGVLQMILKQAGEWKRIEEFYEPLPVPRRRAGHSISSEQESLLREVALSRPKWALAARCMALMLSTTMGFGELRQLRRKDVDMQRRCITVREGAKNEHRERTIPLNSSAHEAMAWILDRWRKLGGSSEEHYILPHRPRRPEGPWLMDEPMTAITSAFGAIRKAAGLPKFRIYDCRVQAITKLLSNPAVSPQVSKEIAGHISQAMQDRYSIQQFDTKKAALDALEDPFSRPPEAMPPVPASSAPMDFTHAMFQAEIARQIALALQERFPTAVAPDTPAREKRTRRRRNADRVIRQPSPKVISFPGPELHSRNLLGGNQ
jgi:integrase